MYRKESEGWFKHIDFILIDMICLQVAFYLAYVLKGLGVNPYADLVYRNMAIVIEFADLAAMFMLDTLTHDTERALQRIDCDSWKCVGSRLDWQCLSVLYAGGCSIL